MLRECHACRLAGLVKCCPNESLVHPETIYANCLVLIVLCRIDEAQSWRGLAGDEGSEKSAVIYNIYRSLKVFISVLLQLGRSKMVNGHV